MDKKILTEMFDNLLHIGNKTNYWNPKMKSFIHGSSNGVHIIDLTQTITQLDNVAGALAQYKADGKKVLFVATKLQARDAFSKLAIDTGNFYVSEKWVPGLLTNFKTIKRRIATYLQLLRDSQGTGFDMLTKKEKAAKMLELEKLDKAFKWVKEMKKTPDVIFVVDGIFEGQATKEAKSLGLPCFAIANTNGNPFDVTDAIPANTNSVKSLDYLAAALSDGMKKAPVTKKEAPKKAIEKKAPVTASKAPAEKAEAKPAAKTAPAKKPTAAKAEEK